jgi:hypothetical protein
MFIIFRYEFYGDAVAESAADVGLQIKETEFLLARLLKSEKWKQMVNTVKLSHIQKLKRHSYIFRELSI